MEWLEKLLLPALGTFLGAILAHRIWLKQTLATELASYDKEVRERRHVSYSALWKHLGVLALYSREPLSNKDLAALQDALTQWYFEHGALLTEAARDHYFVLQDLIYLTMRDCPTFELDRAKFDPTSVAKLRTDEVTKGLAPMAWKKKKLTLAGSTNERVFILLQTAASFLRTTLAADLQLRHASQLRELLQKQEDIRQTLDTL